MIQLRIRTEYSFGKTYAKIDTVIKRLKEIGCTTAGVVDPSTWCHTIFHSKCVEAGIQPLLGVEIAVTDGDLPTKMWFIAKNEDGLRELYNFNSLSYNQPIKDPKFGDINRLYISDVEKISDTNNVHIFAGDILDGEFLTSVNAIIDLNPSSIVLNKKKQQIADKYNLRVVSTSDNNYCYEDDVDAFKIISKTGKKMTPQHILPVLENQAQAELIANQCSTFNFSKAPMIREEGDLEALCREGIIERGLDKNWSKEYEERLQYELELIKSKDFESYFIIVSDMVRYAKRYMLVGPSRGCFLPKQNVITTNSSGNQTIKSIENINEKYDYVLDACGTKQKVLNKFEYEINEEIIQLEFDDGTTLSCTKDHEILTHNGYIKAEYLDNNHIICSIDKNNMRLSKLRQNGWPEHLAHKVIDLGFIFPEDVKFVDKGSKLKVKFICDKCGHTTFMQIRHFTNRSNGFKNSCICKSCYPKIISNHPDVILKNSLSQLKIQGTLEQKIKNAISVSNISNSVQKYDLIFGFIEYNDEVYKLHGGVCYECTSDVDLLLHHIDSNQNKNSHPSNLAILCRSCHTTYHNYDRYSNLLHKTLKNKYSRISKFNIKNNETSEIKKILELFGKSL